MAVPSKEYTKPLIMARVLTKLSRLQAAVSAQSVASVEIPANLRSMLYSKVGKSGSLLVITIG